MNSFVSSASGHSIFNDIVLLVPNCELPRLSLRVSEIVPEDCSGRGVYGEGGDSPVYSAL